MSMSVWAGAVTTAPGRAGAATSAPRAVAWASVGIGGGGYVTGLATGAPGGTVVARTDIGGAYRWDAPTRRWRPLLDRLGLGLGDAGYSVESLVADRRNAANLWAAVGRVRAGGGPSAVVRSTDGGATWRDTRLPSTRAAINGNLDLRWTGERLLVDPRDSERVFFGTRGDGLWVYERGAWTRRASVPAGGGVPSRREGYSTAPVGVSFVTSTRPTGTASVPVFYVGVWEQGVYRSTDGGVTFTRLAGSPLDPVQGAVSPADASLRVTARAASDQPYSVYRYDRGTWADERPCGGACPITVQPNPPPPGQPVACTTAPATDPYPGRVACSAPGPSAYSLSGIDVDGAGNVVVAARTEDRDHAPGAVWLCPYAAGRSCAGRWTGIVAEAAGEPGWLRTIPSGWATATVRFAATSPGSAAPSLWLTTWFDVKRATRGTDGVWRWTDATAGIEETVVHTVLATTTSASDPLVASGVADVDGFTSRLSQPVSGTPFPEWGDVRQGGSQETTGLAASATGAPRILYRVGVGQKIHTNPGGWSADNGLTWTAFAASAGAVGGRVAVAPDDRNRLVWLPELSQVRASSDRGASWALGSGVDTTNVVLHSYDRNGSLAATTASNGNPGDDDFYVYSPKMGLWRAAATGSSFTRAGAGLPAGIAGGWPGQRWDMATDPGRSGTLAVGTCGTASSGLWVSTDRGTTFASRPGLACAQLVAFGPALPGTSGTTSTLYAVGRRLGTDPIGLYASGDLGVTWTALSGDGLPQERAIQSLTADPVVPGRIAVATNGRGAFTGQIG
ncbi:MAG: hypothetical protein HYX34_15535 [Actinobacteria bacterium]|nr:hypothetical protein [Actinomycetota bacterium]